MAIGAKQSRGLPRLSRRTTTLLVLPLLKTPPSPVHLDASSSLPPSFPSRLPYYPNPLHSFILMSSRRVSKNSRPTSDDERPTRSATNEFTQYIKSNPEKAVNAVKETNPLFRPRAAAAKKQKPKNCPPPDDDDEYVSESPEPAVSQSQLTLRCSLTYTLRTWARKNAAVPALVFSLSRASSCTLRA